jgi:arginine decarboxylase
VFKIDLTLMPELDSIFYPQGVIKEAQDLAAEAFLADNAYFIVNGTTAGIQGMIMAACRPSEKVILPRNVHKSVFGALILSGAEPIYVPAELDPELGIALGVELEQVEHAIRAYPEARAVFVLNPTYYGLVSDLPAIVTLAHDYDMAVLVDEAHGAHFCFQPLLPWSAMEAGADLAALSIHKVLGSLTQSSLVVQQGERIDPGYLKTVFNLTQTTSPSYVLLASLDVARKQAYLEGERLLRQAINLGNWARHELNNVPGTYVFGSEMIGQPGCYGIDPTKLCINVRRLGLTGRRAEEILRRDYRIQVELSDPYNVLALVTIGDNKQNVRRLVNAVQQISGRYPVRPVPERELGLPGIPELALVPKEAFYADKRPHEFKAASGKICGELIMAYPPGIPIICPGEIITEEIIHYIERLKETKTWLQGMKDPTLEQILVIR